MRVLRTDTGKEHREVIAHPNPGVYSILRSTRMLLPLALFLIGLMLVMFAGIGSISLEFTGTTVGWLLVASVVLLFVSTLEIVKQLRKQLLKPLAALEVSVAQICQGEPSAALPAHNTGVLAGMVRDIDSLSEELTDLYEDMDSRISRHTTRLAQKTASLKILYDVAASINQVENLDDLLIRYLRILKEMVNGLAATGRVIQRDGQMRLVGSIGLDDVLLREQELLPITICPCGSPLSPGDILCRSEAGHCSEHLGRKMFTRTEVDMITVPLEHHGDMLGVYNIYVPKPGVSEREDILELLETIGSHLGMAVAKQRSDEEAMRLSIVEERNFMAHELHDSLAQTLASLRFQVRMMEDTLNKEGSCIALENDLQRIHNGVDEAHTELRELLASFRAPVGGRGLDAVLRKLLERFEVETGIATYFQQECSQINLSSSEEIQILRIVQEALVNARKHSKAHTVRLLFTCRKGSYNLLVEDDGCGFEGSSRKGHPGEHIGLSIMEERAKRLGGILRIESEPGEGTRVELTYKAAGEKKKEIRSE